MRVTTMETVAGRVNEETVGVVRGAALWSKRITKYCNGGLRGLQYTTMVELAEGLNSAKEEAEQKAQDQAKALGADSIIGLRLEVFEMTEGLFTAVATGTAVRTSELPKIMPSFAAPANDDAFEALPYVQKRSIHLASHVVH